MTDKKQLAQHLYMTQGKTQKEIAAETGVSERTIYTWIHQYAWDKLKRAAYQGSATITENLCSQLIELQDAIAKREPGQRYPTPQESEVTRKLIVCIEKMKKYPSLSQNMQMLETFKNYMRPIDKEFTNKLSGYTERFLSGKSVNGFSPYQMEYGIEQVAPIMAFYDEPGTNENINATDTLSAPQIPPLSAPHTSSPSAPRTPTPSPSFSAPRTPSPSVPVPCPNFNTCLHPGDCTWPHCKRTQEFYNSISPDPLKKNGITPIPAMIPEEREQQYHNYMKANGFQNEPPSPGSSQPEATGSIPATIPPPVLVTPTVPTLTTVAPEKTQEIKVTYSNAGEKIPTAPPADKTQIVIIPEALHEGNTNG